MKKIFLIITLTLMHVGCGNPSVEYNPSGGSSHPEKVFTLFSDTTGVTMTNAPAIGSEITNNMSRAYVDLATFSQVRGQFSNSLATTLVFCRLEYSLDDGTNWDTLVSDFASNGVANGHAYSDWAEIPSAAKANVLVRAVIVGNGVLDPIIRHVRLGYH
ncbi:MAG: hypothetical protein IPM57_11650 [Oligoflexia bacterium]|nr:hypothetical protein [Oligoflexia bacterium]